MTSKRPVTHPALHAALNDGVWRDAAIAPPDAPREPLGGAEAPSGTTGRGEGSDAADGRTAAQEAVVERAARAILAGLKAKDLRDCEAMTRAGITPARVRPDWRVESWTAAQALAEAGLLRDDADLTSPHVEIGGQRMTEAQFLAARMPLYSGFEGLEGEVARFKGQRDDLLAMKARVEARVDEYKRDDDDHLDRFGQHHPVAATAHDHLRDAIRGES